MHASTASARTAFPHGFEAAGDQIVTTDAGSSRFLKIYRFKAIG
jgi:hypothetical protein